MALTENRGRHSGFARQIGRPNTRWNRAPVIVGSTCSALFLVVSLWPSESAARWQITATAATEEAYTDNVNSSSTDDRRHDWINSTTAGVNLSGSGGRSRGNFTYNLSRDTYARESTLDGFRHSLLGAGDIDLYDEYLSLDGRASVSEEYVSQSGTTTATDRTTSTNRTRILNYSISPTFRHGNDGWADSILTYRFNGTRSMTTGTDTGTGDGGVSNSVTHEIVSSMISGRRFSVLTWQFDATTTYSFNDSQFTSKQDVYDGNFEYRLSRQLSILGSAGYDKIRAKDTEDDGTSGFWYSGGLRLTPGPKTNLNVNYEKRYDDTRFTGDIVYRFSPQTSLQGSYSADFSTQQTALSDSLNNLILNDDGDLVDATTGLPADPNDLQTDLVDSTFVSQNLNLGLTGTRGRSTFSLGVNLTKRSFSGTEGNSDSSLTVSGSFSRRLSRMTNLSLSGSYSRSSGSGSPTKSMNGTAAYSYTLSNTLNASANYARLYQNTEGSPAVKENTVSVRLNKEF